MESLVQNLIPNLWKTWVIFGTFQKSSSSSSALIYLFAILLYRALFSDSPHALPSHLSLRFLHLKGISLIPPPFPDPAWAPALQGSLLCVSHLGPSPLRLWRTTWVLGPLVLAQCFICSLPCALLLQVCSQPAFMEGLLCVNHHARCQGKGKVITRGPCLSGPWANCVLTCHCPQGLPNPLEREGAQWVYWHVWHVEGRHPPAQLKPRSGGT